MKKNKGWKISYIVLVVLLLAAMAFGLKYVWDQCRLYQDNSANTLVLQAKDELEKKLGYSLESNFIPKTKDGLIYDYTLTKDKKSVAKVTLEQTGSGIMNLALFKFKNVESLVTYHIVLSEGDVITVDGEVYDYSESAKRYYTPSSDTLYDWGFDFPDFEIADVTSAYDIAQIKVKRADQDLKLVKLENNTFFAAPEFNEETKNDITQRAIGTADAYSHYVSDDIEFGVLYNYILSNSPVIGRMASVINEWYAYHASAVMENIKISEPLYLGERWALISTSYDYNVDIWTEIDTFPTDLSLIMYKDDYGYWYVAELSTYLVYDQLSLLDY